MAYAFGMNGEDQNGAITGMGPTSTYSWWRPFSYMEPSVLDFITTFEFLKRKKMTTLEEAEETLPKIVGRLEHCRHSEAIEDMRRELQSISLHGLRQLMMHVDNADNALKIDIENCEEPDEDRHVGIEAFNNDYPTMEHEMIEESHLDKDNVLVANESDIEVPPPDMETDKKETEEDTDNGGVQHLHLGFDEDEQEEDYEIVYETEDDTETEEDTDDGGVEHLPLGILVRELEEETDDEEYEIESETEDDTETDEDTDDGGVEHLPLGLAEVEQEGIWRIIWANQKNEHLMLENELSTDDEFFTLD